MSLVLAETQPVIGPAPCPADVCPDCGHAHHCHRGALRAEQRWFGGICLAAVPVKRSGEPPELGEFTTGKGSAHDFAGSVCACDRCRCARCREATL